MTTSGSDIRPPNAATPYPERPERFNGLSGANGGESAPAPNDAAPSEVEESKGSAPAVPTASQGAEPEISSGGSQAAPSSGDDEPAPAKSGGYTETFTTTSRGTVKRTVRGPQYGDYDTSKPSKKTPSEPSLGDGIGAFFKVLFAWISGLVNRDMSEFDVLSRVYFPDDPDMQRRKEIMMANRTYNPEAVRQVLQDLPNNLGLTNARTAILHFIGKYEGANNNFNVTNGHRGMNANDEVQLDGKWRKLTDMSVADVMRWQKQYPNGDPAVGAYQFIPSTLAGVVAKAEAAGQIDRNTTKFSPQTQALLANYLLEGRGFSDYMAGKIPLDRFMRQMSEEWAILPKDASGAGHWDGQYGNKANAGIYPAWKQLLETIQQNGEDMGRPAQIASAGGGDKSPAPAAPAAPVAKVEVGKL